MFAFKWVMREGENANSKRMDDNGGIDEYMVLFHTSMNMAHFNA